MQLHGFPEKRLKTINCITSLMCSQPDGCHIQRGPKQNRTGTRPVRWTGIRHACSMDFRLTRSSTRLFSRSIAQCLLLYMLPVTPHMERQRWVSLSAKSLHCLLKTLWLRRSSGKHKVLLLPRRLAFQTQRHESPCRWLTDHKELTTHQSWCL